MINFPISDLGIRTEDLNYFVEGPYNLQTQASEEHQTEAHNAGSSSCGGSSSVVASSSEGSKRRRTASVWVDGYFEERIVVLEDGTKKIKAVCKWPGCDKMLSGASTSGTGHLERHYRKHKVLSEQAAVRTQGELGFAPDGHVGNFNYNPELSRKGLCHMIAAHDLPLGFGEYPAVVDWIRTCHNPRYQLVSRQTTSRDMKKLASKMAKELKDDFAKCTFSVSLTSDIWSGRAKQDYLSVVEIGRASCRERV